MDTYREFCIRFWEDTRELDLYSMDGSQLDRLIVDALLKTNGGKELKKTSMNELSVLIRAINHNNRKIQSPSLPSDLDEAADSFAQEHFRREYFQVPRDGMRAAFKAGAEWMAGQGETAEGVFRAGDPGYIRVQKILAIAFMNLLDRERPEGKMCLSNMECADIEDAFKVGDWDKLFRYAEKYIKK